MKNPAKKRVISFLLALALIFGMLPNYAPAPALAAETEDGFGYTIYKNEVVISEYTGRATDVVIPTEIEGYPVKHIGDTFRGNTSITSIDIPEGVALISRYAFADCSHLTSIKIPSSVTSIEAFAFENCSSLTSIAIPQGVETLEQWTFAECNSLISVDIPSSMISIGNYAFYKCSNLNSVTLPSNLTNIGQSAFGGCSNLTSIAIPENLMNIENSVFEGCSSLTSITIPEGVTSIGDYAFRICSSLESITIPSSVTSIGKQAFGHTPVGLRMYFEGDPPVFDEKAFDGARAYAFYPANNSNWTAAVRQNYGGDITWISLSTDETEEEIPSGLIYEVSGYQVSITDYTGTATELVIPSRIEGYPVTGIGTGAFADCSSLASVTIPEGVTGIGAYAFTECSNLTSITIPESVTSIGGSAFLGCSSLTNVTIPEGVTKILALTFKRCTSLENVTIPASVTSIGDCAFVSCSSLTSITIPNSVTSIVDSFESCGALTKIVFEGDAPEIGSSTFYGVTANAYYPADNATWTEDVMMDYGGNVTWVAYGKGVTLGGNVTSYNDATATVTVELLQNGEVVKTTTTTGNSASYSFSDVEAGTYTLRVSKANHVPRSYEITVGETDIMQDVTLVPVGDLTGDGKVTATDYSRLFAHVKKTSNIADEYVLSSADVTGDGKITATDYSRLLAHVKKVSPLW